MNAYKNKPPRFGGGLFIYSGRCHTSARLVLIRRTTTNKSKNMAAALTHIQEESYQLMFVVITFVPPSDRFSAITITVEKNKQLNIMLLYNHAFSIKKI
jgi:hypothetical protein